jgi:hypothetical protein
MKAVSEARDMLAHQDADSIKSSASIAQDVRAKADAIANSLL